MKVEIKKSTDAYYKQLLEEVSQTNDVDLIDVELFSPHVNEIVETAKNNDVTIVNVQS